MYLNLAQKILLWKLNRFSTVGENPGNEVGASTVLTIQIRAFTERIVN